MAFIFIILISLFIIYIINFYWNVARYPRGPLPMPVIGNLYMVSDPKKLHLQMDGWSKIYGPVFTVFLPNPMVVITQYDAMKEALITKGDDFLGRSGEFPENVVQTIPNGGVIFSDGDEWSIQRRTSLHILRDFGMGKNIQEQMVQNSLREFVDYIDNLEDKSRVEFRWPIQILVANVINELLYSWRYGYHDCEALKTFANQLTKNIEIIRESKLTFLVMAFPWIKHIPVIGYHAYHKFFDILKVCREMVEQDVRNCLTEYHEDAEPQCFIHAYKQRIDKGDPGLSTPQLQNVVMDFFLAGMETTTTTLRWVVLHFANSPEVQEKCRQEIMSVVGTERMVSMSDKLNLPYTSACVCEIQRIANILPLNLFRRTLHDTEVCGTSIPQNTIILPQINSILRLDEAFGTDLDKFMPERFLLEDGKTANKVAVDHLVPFGMGGRKCAGEALARVELFLGIATILQNFRLLPAQGWTLNVKPTWFAINVPSENYLKVQRTNT